MRELSEKRNGSRPIYVGLDVSRRSIEYSILRPDAAESGGRIANKPGSIEQLFRRLKRDEEPVVAAYEAGDGGYTIFRILHGLGVECHVIAPFSRAETGVIKTDKRDARFIAESLQLNQFRSVWIPTVEMQAARQLLKLRQDEIRERLRAGQHIERVWINNTGMADAAIDPDQLSPGDRVALDNLQDKSAACTLREGDYLEQIKIHAAEEPLKTRVELLSGFRGIDLLTAVGIVCEIGDCRRFASPERLASFAGLVPVTRASGQRRVNVVRGYHDGDSLRQYFMNAAIHIGLRKHETGKRAEARRRQLAPDDAQYLKKASDGLVHFAASLLARGKAPAVVQGAVARKLSEYVWRVLMRLETRLAQ